MICKIVLPLPLEREFDYAVPDLLAGAAQPGLRAQVQFGHRNAVGVIVGVAESSRGPFKLKEITSLIDDKPLFGPELFALSRFITENWGSSTGETLSSLLPDYLKPDTAARAAMDIQPCDESGFTADQRGACADILRCVAPAEFGEFLLFGVPRSGRTEICLKVTHSAVSAGGQTLILVPDIALAAPLAEKAGKILGSGAVLLWHSRLTPLQRRVVWAAVASGAPCVVVGSRSACLLPFQNLRAAFVYEEQDDMYKQEENRPYYSARDVVSFRARYHKCPAVFCSGAPSLETLRKAVDGKLKLLRLKETPVPINPPAVVFAKKRGTESPVVSDQLKLALAARLERGEKALVIINRKGFAGALACFNCGWIAQCPKCGAGAALRKKSGGEESLLCARCGAESPKPAACPKCANRIFRPLGAGTVRAAEEIKKLFPAARILRFDSDTLRLKNGEGRIAWQALDDNSADIIVGTRIAARGPRNRALTLAAVLDADRELKSPDFRASEKTCQMLFQLRARLCGVAGAEFYIQTSSPDEPVFAAAQSGDYTDFAMREFDFRKDLGYPPYSRLTRVVIDAKKDETAEKACSGLLELVETAGTGLGLSRGTGYDISGPSPCGKTRGGERRHFIIKDYSGRLNGKLLSEVRRFGVKGATIKITADPQDFH